MLRLLRVGSLLHQSAIAALHLSRRPPRCPQHISRQSFLSPCALECSHFIVETTPRSVFCYAFVTTAKCIHNARLCTCAANHSNINICLVFFAKILREFLCVFSALCTDCANRARIRVLRRDRDCGMQCRPHDACASGLATRVRHQEPSTANAKVYQRAEYLSK